MIILLSPLSDIHLKFHLLHFILLFSSTYFCQRFFPYVSVCVNLTQSYEDEMNVHDKQGNVVVKPCNVPQGNQIDVILKLFL